jgi:tetratricopeptide (TPR) repeat protein
MVKWGLGDFREAEAHLLKYLTMARREKLDPSQLAMATNNLGALYLSMGRLKEAERYALDAMAILESNYGRSHVAIADGEALLGVIYLRTNRNEQADCVLRSALEIAEQRLNPTHPLVGAILLTHAEVLARLKQKPESKAARERAEAILRLHPAAIPGRYTVDLETLRRSPR